MIHIKHLLTVTAAWISIVYTVCFVGVALFPPMRSGFMRYALHTSIETGQNVLSFSTFVSGLIIWNIIGVLSVALFVSLYNRIKQ